MKRTKNTCFAQKNWQVIKLQLGLNKTEVQQMKQALVRKKSATEKLANSFVTVLINNP